MFNVRPAFPWLFVAAEDEPGLLGFNVEPPLLNGFIEIATRQNTGPAQFEGTTEPGQPMKASGFNISAPESAAFAPEGLLPGLLPAQPPMAPGDAPEVELPAEYEIALPPSLGEAIAEERLPQSETLPPLDDRSDPEPETEGDTTLPPSPRGPAPAPAPAPVPSPPVPWSDWLSQVLDRIAGIYGVARQERYVAPLPQAPGSVPERAVQSWSRSDTWGDSRPNAGEPLPRAGGLDPRYIVLAGGPSGTGKPPDGPRDGAPGSKQTEASRPPRDHNGPPGPSPDELPEAPPPRASPPAQRQRKLPRFRMPGWRDLLVELLRHMPIEQAIDALWESEHAWEFDQHVASITPTVRIAGSESPDVHGPSARGRRRLDVPLSDHLPEPQTSENYSPKTENQRKGAVGEFHLANRAVERIPGETVIYYGIPGGATGADIISVSKNGTISVWDSKWRGSVRSITELMRGYQRAETVAGLVRQVRRIVADAVSRGELDRVDALKALRNASAGNFFINTIGTGEAHSGVVQQVLNGVPGEIRRIPK